MPAPQEFLAYVEQHTDQFVDRLAKAVAIPVSAHSLMSRAERPSASSRLDLARAPMRHRAHICLVFAPVRLRRCGLQVRTRIALPRHLQVPLTSLLLLCRKHVFEMTDFSELRRPSCTPSNLGAALWSAAADWSICSFVSASAVVSELEALGCETVVRKPLGTQELEGQTLVSSPSSPQTV